MGMTWKTRRVWGWFLAWGGVSIDFKYWGVKIPNCAAIQDTHNQLGTHPLRTDLLLVYFIKTSACEREYF